MVDREGFKPSQEVCRTSMLSLHHQPKHFQLPICDCRLASWLSCARHRISQSAMGNWQSAMIWWLWVESNHQPRAYETLALIPLELHSRLQSWKPAEELNLVPFHPALLRFGLEDRRRERGPVLLTICDCRLPIGFAPSHGLMRTRGNNKSARVQRPIGNRISAMSLAGA